MDGAQAFSFFSCAEGLPLGGGGARIAKVSPFPSCPPLPLKILLCAGIEWPDGLGLGTRFIFNFVASPER